MLIARAAELIPANWGAKQEATLIYVTNGHSVLLIKKLRGIGKGKVNAPGGKLESGESPMQCAVRELNEEVGLTTQNPRLLGELRFRDIGNGFSLDGYVFVTFDWSGDLVSTREAEPFWCSIADIPYPKMWEDDQFWLPHVLRGSFVRGDLLFVHDKLKELYLEIES